MITKRIPGKRSGTVARPTRPSGTGTTTGIKASKPAVKLFTQNQVNDLMRKRVERSHQSFFNRYGVKDLKELDGLFGQSRSYGPMKQKYDELTTQHNDLVRRYAYKMGNINEAKIPDIEAYFKGKGLEINEETLAQELKTHPDWVNKVGSVEVIGSEVTTPVTQSDAEIAGSLLGVNLT